MGEVGRELSQTVMTEREMLKAVQTKQCFSTEFLDTVVVQVQAE